MAFVWRNAISLEPKPFSLFLMAMSQLLLSPKLIELCLSSRVNALFRLQTALNPHHWVKILDSLQPIQHTAQRWEKIAHIHSIQTDKGINQLQICKRSESWSIVLLHGAHFFCISMYLYSLAQIPSAAAIVLSLLFS